MAKVLFQRVAILGLGLMGGSLALELSRKKLAKEVVAYNRGDKRRRLAKRKGYCTAAYADPKQAVVDADLIVLATPVQQMLSLAKEIAPAISPRAIITDLGSTKVSLVKGLKKILPKHCYYVGGHPMAGTEKSGVESAVPDLFKERWWFLTPADTRAATTQALKRLEKLLRLLGAKPKRIKAREHDALLAKISHLPQVIASTLISTVDSQKGALHYAAGGLKDTTRIAASPAQMWTEICLENKNEILKALKAFQKNINHFEKLLTTGQSKKLNAFFETASNTRKKLK